MAKMANSNPKVIVFIVNKDTIDRCLTRKIVAGKAAVKNGLVVEGTQIIIYDIILINLDNHPIFSLFSSDFNHILEILHVVRRVLVRW
jgi:hypothetical protein